MTEQINPDLDYAMQAAADPRMQETEEFRLWLRDDGHRATFIEAMACKEALLRERLARKQQLKLRIAYRSVAAIAAALLVALLLPLGRQLAEQRPERLFAAVEGATQVMLHCDGCAQQMTEQTVLDLNASREAPQAAAGYQTLQTPRGKDFQVVLADGTRVWLNAETQLRYPATFDGQERRVELTGEACFEVTRDEQRPFVVSAGGMDIRVLGTRFNVRSYDPSDRHVTLVSGKVELTDDVRGSVVLQPGEDLTYAENGEHAITQVNTTAYTAWTDGMFYFEDAPLEEIMRALGRWYNVNIDLRSRKELAELRLHFWADRDSTLPEVLALLNKLGKVRAEFRNGTVTVKSI